MDIYEFTQALWRRKWLLLIGFALLLLMVARMAFDFSSGQMRVEPKYEAKVDMAVVPADFDSLAVDLGADSLAGQANIFASLAGSTQAAMEIEEQQGVPVLGLTVFTTGRDRFFSVTAMSNSPDGAVAAALGSFHWLEKRLVEPVLVSSSPTTTAPPKELLDKEGNFEGTVVVQLDHALIRDGEGLWLVVRTAETSDFAVRLDDAGIEAMSEYTALLPPGRDIVIDLENSFGDRLDSATVTLPTLPETEAETYQMVMGVQRGVIRGSAESPSLDAARIDVAWEPVTSREEIEATALSEVGVLLLTDSPVPYSIGGRRTPLLIIAVLTAGSIALLVLAVSVDSWSQERRRRRQPLFEGPPAVVVPDESVPIPLSGRDAPYVRRRTSL